MIGRESGDDVKGKHEGNFPYDPLEEDDEGAPAKLKWTRHFN